MTTNEYVQFILEVKKENLAPRTIDEAAASDAAQLISGSFIYSLYEALWMDYIDVESITQHLESLYDSNNHHGLVYFIILLADAIAFSVPATLTEMSATDALIPYLSSAIIEDWLEYHATCEIAETV